MLFAIALFFAAAFVLLRRARRLIAVLALVSFWGLGSGWLSGLLLKAVQHGAADRAVAIAAGRIAIVVLGAGTRYREPGHILVPRADGLLRVQRAATLYETCERTAQRCTVILSGGNPQRHDAAEADNYRPYLTALGVPEHDIVLENHSNSTHQNARFVSAWLAREKFDSVLLVTSAYHMRRAQGYFAYYGVATVPVIANAREASATWLPSRHNLTNSSLALHEIVGLAQLQAYRALRWFH